MSDTLIEEDMNSAEKPNGSISEMDISDDDFGDFEEVDQEETPTLASSLENDDTVLVHYFDGDYEKERPAIDQLVNEMFGSCVRDDPIQLEYQFDLDDRSEKIYERLVAEDDRSTTGFIWKRSVIYKQMLLNLDIEESETLTQHHPVTSAHSSGTQFQKLYDLEQEIDSENDMTKLLQQIPDFKSIGLDADSKEVNNMLRSTSNTLQIAKEMLMSDDIEKLTKMKIELLQLASVWDEHTRSVKDDNELFTSYVENLIGNTQKMRREKRILQTKSKRKSMRFHK